MNKNTFKKEKKPGKYILGVDQHLFRKQNSKYKSSELKTEMEKELKLLWTITLSTKLNTRKSKLSPMSVCFLWGFFVVVVVNWSNKIPYLMRLPEVKMNFLSPPPIQGPCWYHLEQVHLGTQEMRVQTPHSAAIIQKRDMQDPSSHWVSGSRCKKEDLNRKGKIGIASMFSLSSQG